jgi:hypothetical protein
MGVPLGPVLDPIMEIDILVGVMNLLTLVHAARSGASTRGAGSTRSGSGLAVCLFAMVLAFGVEFASVWVGATHCHGESVAMVTPCSSFNSVLYYVSAQGCMLPPTPPPPCPPTLRRHSFSSFSFSLTACQSMALYGDPMCWVPSHL